MQAWQVSNTGDREGLALVTLDEPDRPRCTIVEVRAAGVGFPDLLMRRGEFQIAQPVPFVLGWEAAGIVIDTAPGSGFSVGDRVVTMSFGAWAERIVAEPSATFPLPAELSFAEGAALPLNSFTALAALRRGRVGAGDTVLVHGAAGGAGTAAVQLARAKGAHVIAVVSTPAKAGVAVAAGAHATVSINDDWRAEVRAATGSRGVDVVIDPVGGDRFSDSLRCLASQGRYVVVGFAGGSIPTVPASRLLLRNVDVCGCTWSVLAEHEGGLRAAFAELAGHVAEGTLRPLIGERYAFADAPAALDAMDQRRSTGKLVLEL